MSAAEEAIARAKAIAARLAGTGATAATTPDVAPAMASTSTSTPAASVSAPVSVANNDVNSVAEAALAAAFGGGGGGVGGGNGSNGGSAPGDGGSSNGSKRKRWDSSGGGESSLNNDALAEAMNAKRLNTGGGSSGGAPTTKKVYIPVEKNPGYNYIGLLIGPGGSKQRELINQSGGNVKISIRGKGSSSSNNNESPGKPEEPLHVLLEGNQENVNNAEKLVSELLHDSEKAQAEKDRQLAVVNSSKNDGSAPTSSYTPKPVAQLLGLNGSGHYGPVAGAEVIEEKIGIPNAFVGFIIGKGGESITSMQRKSGCRVQIQKEHEMEPGTTQRIITLTASTQEAISMCRGIIEEMVLERSRLNAEGANRGPSGPGSNAAGQAAQLQIALSQGHAHVTVPVPNNDVGLVIGKGGMTIRSIQERSGANVQIPPGPDVDNPMIRTVNITHPQMDGADFAKTLVEEVLKNKLGNQQGYGSGPVAGGISVQVQIPDKDVGMCIGKSGCVIREMQQRTQTRIQIPSQPTPGQIYRIATVSGPAEGCQKVQEIINRIIMEQSSQFVMNGQAFGEYGQTQGYGMYGQQQQYGAAAATGGEDYSAQWAAYYAAQAANQNGTTSAATPASAPAGGNTGATAGDQPAADAYYDAFFRYAYHYGEDAARQYYGAWSPPAGTANPYGVNPAGITPAPAPADGGAQG